MTPQNHENTSVEMMVAIGRIEEKLNGMATTEARTGERLDKIDSRLTNVELNMATNLKPRAPWWVIAGGMAALATGAIAVITLLNIAGKLAEVLG